MITETQASKCTTHHHACDCREWQFQELLRAAEDLINSLSGLDLYLPSDVDEQRVEFVKSSSIRLESIVSITKGAWE